MEVYQLSEPYIHGLEHELIGLQNAIFHNPRHQEQCVRDLRRSNRKAIQIKTLQTKMAFLGNLIIPFPGITHIFERKN